jgi:DNA invertase Pin-like site-specific DNA recombinase
MSIQKFGYGRVSTLDQNLHSQVDALLAAGVPKDSLFMEKITGTKASRPQLDLVRQMLRPGDTLVITRMDRLGRSTKDLLTIVSELSDKSVNLEIIEQKIDTKTPEGKLFFTLVAAFAEFEHSMMVSRTKDGLAAARARGRVGGRKAKLSLLQMQEIQKLYLARELTVQQISEMFNVSRPTVYRAIESIPEVIRQRQSNQ